MDVIETGFLPRDAEGRAAFTRQVERSPFMFHHRLGESPLFQMPALRELAGFFSDNALPFHMEVGGGTVASKWASGPAQLSLLEAFDAIPTSNNILIMLNRAHRQPQYDVLLHSFLDELGDILHCDIMKNYHEPICTILIASPGRVTPYHIDNSMNFLMQIAGSKAFYIFDGSDPEILTNGEVERFWGAGDPGAAEWTEAKQLKALPYDLGPGLGVHVPCPYPHWAQNGSEVSVAVSINIRHMIETTADVHRLNHRLRRLGLAPTPPGQSRLKDGVKAAAMQAMRSVKQVARRAPGS